MPHHLNAEGPPARPLGPTIAPPPGDKGDFQIEEALAFLHKRLAARAPRLITPDEAQPGDMWAVRRRIARLKQVAESLTRYVTVYLRYSPPMAADSMTDDSFAAPGRRRGLHPLAIAYLAFFAVLILLALSVVLFGNPKGTDPVVRFELPPARRAAGQHGRHRACSAQSARPPRRLRRRPWAPSPSRRRTSCPRSSPSGLCRQRAGRRSRADRAERERPSAAHRRRRHAADACLCGALARQRQAAHRHRHQRAGHQRESDRGRALIPAAAGHRRLCAL